MYLIVSLFSVFVENHWIPIKDFIESECPYVMKSGFECLKMNSFQYATIGVCLIFNINLVSGIKNNINGLSNKQYCCDCQY